MKTLPERGRIGIFNRSYYEEVLVVKVHRELLSAEHIPNPKSRKKLWQEPLRRYQPVRAAPGAQRHLILKFFLHVSKEEQRKRFLDRVNKPDKHWKFSPDDIHERQFWDKYMEAYEGCLTQTSTDWAPWYIVRPTRNG